MKHQKIAFLFPGQGAQIVGMGRDFYETFREAKDVFDEGESLLKTDIKKLIFSGPEELLKETKYSQTAIYLTSMAMLRALEKQFPHLVPSFAAGLSLGEYTALTCAGNFRFQEALLLVHERGAYMHEACEKNKGGMAAILGLPSHEVKKLVAEIDTSLWVANYNSSDQTVISGSVEGVERGASLAKERGAKRVIPLKVHGAFHSGLMQSAADRLRGSLLQSRIERGSVPVVMNVTGKYVDDPEEIRRLLVDQVTHSVLWEDTIVTLKDGCDLYLEIGPGKTLAGLNKQMGVMAPTISINKVQDLDGLMHL